MEIISHKKYYRSKFYSMALSSNANELQQREKDVLTSRFLRKSDYADHIKHNHMPKAD